MSVSFEPSLGGNPELAAAS